jgi:hypothetical protein
MNAPSEEAVVACRSSAESACSVAGFAALLSVPSIVAGIGLLSYRPWARIVTLVLSGFLLIHIPFGTLLGFYGFWVLLSKEAIPLFEHRATAYVYPTATIR